MKILFKYRVNGIRDYYEEYVNSTLDFILGKVDELDGKTFDDALIEFTNSTESRTLMVQGGRSERVVVSFTNEELRESQKLLYLVDSKFKEKEFEQNIGGQYSELAGKYNVDLPLAKQAIKYFYDKKAPHPKLVWKNF
jgi:hypothetical protein